MGGSGGVCDATILSTTEDYPDAIAADSQSLYWANQTAVIKASNTGSMSTVVNPRSCAAATT